MARMHTLSIGA